MQTAGAEKPLELRIDSKAYASADGTPRQVLRDFALQLAAGSCVSLVGPSGCGKTSILRIAAGLDRDFVGERWMAPSVRVGMVFQEPRLLAWRTVEENIRIAMEAAAVTGDIGEWLKRFDLLAQRRQFAGELSLGQARRVAMARALSIRPNLLLLDEPLVSLDEGIAARLRRELRAFADSGNVAMLLVTHDLDEAVELSDRLLFLDDRPARIVLEKEVWVPRGHRDRNTVAALAREFSELAGTAKTGSPHG